LSAFGACFAVPSQRAAQCWKWGLIYVNPEDTRLWVPKRYGGGWTFNFAHPRAKVYMVLLLALPLVLTAVLVLTK